MKIQIISAIGGSKTDLDVDSTTTIREIKEKISNMKRIPVDTFVFAFQGKELEDTLTIKEAGIDDQDKLYLIVRTEGG
ncbi:MAG: ubiquitin family protein [Candidatus Odinarchaeia archaeon]